MFNSKVTWWVICAWLFHADLSEASGESPFSPFRISTQTCSVCTRAKLLVYFKAEQAGTEKHCYLSTSCFILLFILLRTLHKSNLSLFLSNASFGWFGSAVGAANWLMLQEIKPSSVKRRRIFSAGWVITLKCAFSSAVHDRSAVIWVVCLRVRVQKPFWWFHQASCSPSPPACTA